MMNRFDVSSTAVCSFPFVTSSSLALSRRVRIYMYKYDLFGPLVSRNALRALGK